MVHPISWSEYLLEFCPPACWAKVKKSDWCLTLIPHTVKPRLSASTLKETLSWRHEKINLNWLNCSYFFVLAIIKNFLFLNFEFNIFFFCLQISFFLDEDKNLKNTNHDIAGLHEHFNFAVMLMERRLRMVITIWVHFLCSPEHSPLSHAARLILCSCMDKNGLSSWLVWGSKATRPLVSLIVVAWNTTWKSCSHKNQKYFLQSIFGAGKHASFAANSHCWMSWTFL